MSQLEARKQKLFRTHMTSLTIIGYLCTLHGCCSAEFSPVLAPTAVHVNVDVARVRLHPKPSISQILRLLLLLPIAVRDLR